MTLAVERDLKQQINLNLDDDDTAAGPIYNHIGSKSHFNLHIVFSSSNLFNHLQNFRHIKLFDRNLFT